MTNLAEYGIKLSRQTVGSHKTLCPECSHTRKNKHEPCLSVTLDADGGAVWKCHNCDWTGNISTGKYEVRKKIVRKIEPPKTVQTDDKFYRYFADRGISKATVDRFGIFKTHKSFGAADEPCIAFPYRDSGEICNIKYRTADKRFRQEKDARKSFYKLENLDVLSQTEIIIVEGEMDVLSLVEAGFDNVISLPDGAPSQTKFDPDDKRFSILAELENHKFTKVILAGDMDEAGFALAAELEHRFGKDICWRVKWPESQDVTCKDANETLVVHGADAVRECIEFATPNPIDGVYNPEKYTGAVLDLYYGRTAQPLSTGFSNLDEIYKVMPATFNLVTGVPNHGKSNFLDQIIINMARFHDWKFAIYSPEHSTQNHLRRLIEKVVHKPFESGPTERMTEPEVRSALGWLDSRFFFVESGETVPTVDYILEKAKAVKLRHGVNGLVIDPFNKIDATRDGGKREDEHIRDLISKCQRFAQYHNVTVWMVAHPHKLYRSDDGVIPPPDLYQVAGAAHWNNMTDVGMVIHRDFETNETQVIMRKVREQGVYGNIGVAYFRYNTSTRSYEKIDKVC